MKKFNNWPTDYPDPNWFIHDRFGLFIHFGLFSVGARHEWFMTTEQVSLEEYSKKYFQHFNPDLFDADAWAKEAARCGVKYMVFTTKHHEGFALWDTKQTDKPLEKNGMPVIWEACQTMYGTWGYDRDNMEWKSSEMLLKMLIDTVSKNGNFLMNIGPNPRGMIDTKTLERLHAIGDWMTLHKASVIGCSYSAFEAPDDCRYTQNGNKLYLHLFSYPYRNLHLKGLAGKVEFIRLLNDGSEIFYRGFDPDEVITSTEAVIAPEDLVITLPIIKPDVLIPVIEITLKDD